MKIKGIILTAAICAGSVVGISYGVSRVMSSNVKPVEVVEVDSVNTAGYNFFNSDTISGTVVSRDTQSVELDDDHKLVAVYVSAGDSVKKGDKLLEYDMTADELKAESAGKNILISTHAIALKGALEYLTPESKGSYWAKNIGNCAVYRTELTDGAFLAPEAWEPD